MKIVSDETRRKMSLAHMGKPSGMLGKKMTDEHKNKLRIANIGKKMSDSARRKISINTTKQLTGKFGEKSHGWKGGKIFMNGYIKILSPNHPLKDFNGYVFEHRLIMEKKIGRILLRNEVVHHINSIKSDNRIENLVLFSSRGEHIAHHRLTYNPMKKLNNH